MAVGTQAGTEMPTQLKAVAEVHSIPSIMPFLLVRAITGPAYPRERKTWSPPCGELWQIHITKEKCGMEITAFSGKHNLNLSHNSQLVQVCNTKEQILDFYILDFFVLNSNCQ